MIADVFHVVLWGAMGGKANKARRKQERLRQRRWATTGLVGRGAESVRCTRTPGGVFYSSWVDCGSVNKTIAWAEAAMQDRRAADPDVPTWPGGCRTWRRSMGAWSRSRRPASWTATSTRKASLFSGKMTARSPWCRCAAGCVPH